MEISSDQLEINREKLASARCSILLNVFFFLRRRVNLHKNWAAAGHHSSRTTSLDAPMCFSRTVMQYYDISAVERRSFLRISLILYKTGIYSNLLSLFVKIASNTCNLYRLFLLLYWLFTCSNKSVHYELTNVRRSWPHINKHRHAWHTRFFFSAGRVEMGHCVTFKRTKISRYFN